MNRTKSVIITYGALYCYYLVSQLPSTFRMFLYEKWFYFLMCILSCSSLFFIWKIFNSYKKINSLKIQKKKSNTKFQVNKIWEEKTPHLLQLEKVHHAKIVAFNAEWWILEHCHCQCVEFMWDIDKYVCDSWFRKYLFVISYTQWFVISSHTLTKIINIITKSAISWKKAESGPIKK